MRQSQCGFQFMRVLQPERLPYSAFDQIPFYGRFQMFFRHGNGYAAPGQAGVSRFTEAVKHTKRPV